MTEDHFSSYWQFEFLSSLYISSAPNSPFPPYGTGYQNLGQLGFRSHYWLNETSGFESALHTKVFSFDSTINSVTTYNAELYYHHRWFFDKGYYSAIGGLGFFENNPGSVSYKQLVDRYLILKVGFGLDIFIIPFIPEP